MDSLKFSSESGRAHHTSIGFVLSGVGQALSLMLDERSALREGDKIIVAWACKLTLAGKKAITDC